MMPTYIYALASAAGLGSGTPTFLMFPDIVASLGVMYGCVHCQGVQS